MAQSFQACRGEEPGGRGGEPRASRWIQRLGRGLERQAHVSDRRSITPDPQPKRLLQQPRRSERSSALLSGGLTLSVEDSAGEQADQQGGGGGPQHQQQPPLPLGPAGTTGGTAAVEERHLQVQTGQRSGRRSGGRRVAPRSLEPLGHAPRFHGNRRDVEHSAPICLGFYTRFLD